MKKIQYIAFCVLAGLFLFVNVSQASLVDSVPCAQAGSANCSLDDFLRVGINAVLIIYGVAGSLALLFFIYGGIMWLVSAGNPERVKKGTEIIKNAVIGLVIIFSSYMIINSILGYTGFKGSKVWSDTSGSVNWTSQGTQSTNP